MTRSEAPFHGTHGDGRSAISPAASHSDAEPCARTFPAARARRNAPAISDDAVVAAPITGVPKALAIPCPCRARRHNWLKSWQKSIGHADFGCAAALKVRQKNLQLLADGVHPKIAQERLGHSTITTTMDLYSHVTDTMQADAAARLDEAFRAAIIRRVAT